MNNINFYVTFQELTTYNIKYYLGVEKGVRQTHKLEPHCCLDCFQNYCQVRLMSIWLKGEDVLGMVSNLSPFDVLVSLCKLNLIPHFVVGMMREKFLWPPHSYPDSTKIREKSRLINLFHGSSCHVTVFLFTPKEKDSRLLSLLQIFKTFSTFLLLNILNFGSRIKI